MSAVSPDSRAPSAWLASMTLRVTVRAALLVPDTVARPRPNAAWPTVADWVGRDWW